MLDTVHFGVTCKLFLPLGHFIVEEGYLEPIPIRAYNRLLEGQVVHFHQLGARCYEIGLKKYPLHCILSLYFFPYM